MEYGFEIIILKEFSLRVANDLCACFGMAVFALGPLRLVRLPRHLVSRLAVLAFAVCNRGQDVGADLHKESITWTLGRIHRLQVIFKNLVLILFWSILLATAIILFQVCRRVLSLHARVLFLLFLSFFVLILELLRYFGSGFTLFLLFKLGSFLLFLKLPRMDLGLKLLRSSLHRLSLFRYLFRNSLIVSYGSRQLWTMSSFLILARFL